MLGAGISNRPRPSKCHDTFADQQKCLRLLLYRDYAVDSGRNGLHLAARPDDFSFVDFRIFAQADSHGQFGLGKVAACGRDLSLAELATDAHLEECANRIVVASGPDQFKTEPMMACRLVVAQDERSAAVCVRTTELPFGSNLNIQYFLDQLCSYLTPNTSAVRLRAMRGSAPWGLEAEFWIFSDVTVSYFEVSRLTFRLAGVFLAGVRVLAAGLALAFPLPIASRIA